MFLPLALFLAISSSPNRQLQIVEENTFADSGSGLEVVIKAILPDGSHVVLTCSDASDQSCTAVQLLKPKKLPPQDESCQDSMSADNNDSAEYKTPMPGGAQVRRHCVYKDMGWFDFKRSGRYVSIRGRHQTSVLHISGPWR